MRSIINLAILSMLLFSSCEPEEYPQLNFFRVETGSTRAPEGGVFGQLEVEAEIFFEQEAGLALPPIDRYGFRWATDYASLASSRGAITEVVFPPYVGGNPPFDTLSPVLLANQTYYYQAFAKSGERLMLGDIRNTSLNLRTTLSFLERQNDQMSLQAEISGFGSASIPRFGLIVAEEDSGPTLATANWVFDTLNLTSFTLLDAIVEGLSFNTTYYARTFYETDQVYYGAPLAIRVTDGWIQQPNLLPGVPTAQVAVTAEGENAYLFGGTVQTEVYSRQILRYDPGSGELPGAWTRSSVLLVGLTSASALVWDDQLIVGGGAQLSRPYSWFEVDPFRELIACNEPQYPHQFFDGVAFKLNNKIYYGTGRDRQDSEIFYADQFWEMSRSSEGCVELRPVASLPVRVDGVEGSRGRAGAVTFNLDGTQYVGSGRYRGGHLQDLYRFVPPVDDTDLGDWEYVGELPGMPREEAVAFTLGDQAYYGSGANAVQANLKDFYRFDVSTGVWQPVEPFPGDARSSAFAFALGPRAYFGGGVRKVVTDGLQILNSYPQDFWTYIPADDE